MALARWETEALMLPGDVPSLADLTPAQPAWMAQAACRGMDSATFFPSRGEATDEARKVCGGCPVAGPCLAYAAAGRGPRGRVGEAVEAGAAGDASASVVTVRGLSAECPQKDGKRR